MDAIKKHSPQQQPFSAVITPFPRHAICTHPLYRCLPHLDDSKRRVLACSCGELRAVHTEFEHRWWFERRTTMIALAIKNDVGRTAAERTAEIARLTEGTEAPFPEDPA